MTFTLNRLPIKIPPSVAAPLTAAHFGAESADLLADSPGRGIALPAGAMQVPDAPQAWYAAIWFRTGNNASAAEREFIFSRGSQSFGNNTSYLALHERQVTTGAGAWRLEFDHRFSTGNTRFFETPDPAQDTGPRIDFDTDYCFVMAVTPAGLPLVAYGKVGAGNNAHDMVFSGTAQLDFNTLYFPAAVSRATGTVSRTGGVLSVDYGGANWPSSYLVGDVVLVRSNDGTFTEVITIATKVGAVITATSAGADFTAITNINVAEQRSAVQRGEVMKMLGRAESPTSGDGRGFSGSIQRVEMWRGTVPTTSGKIDPTWFRNFKNQLIADADKPGTKQFALDLSDGNRAADADGIVTGTATDTGTVLESAPITPAWLRIDWPTGASIATVAGTRFGDLVVPFSYMATARGLVVKEGTALIGRVLDAGDVELIPAAACGFDMADGEGEIRIDDVPEGLGHKLELWWESNPEYTFTWPFDVAPKSTLISQSTIKYLFEPTLSGGTLAPSGPGGSVIRTSGGIVTSGTNPTDTAAWNRVQHLPVRVAGQAGNGIVAAINGSLALGREGACFVDLTRSGHTGPTFWADGETFRNSIGTAVSDVALTGNWVPQANFQAPSWTKGGTVKLYRDTTLIAQDDGASSGTGSVNLVGAGVTGTFNLSTGAYSVTVTTGGALSIEAEMAFDTASGQVSTRQTPDGFTAFGKRGVANSGQISNIASATKGGVTYNMWSWSHYLLFGITSMSTAELDAYVAAEIDAVRERVEEFTGPVPLIVFPGHRGTGSQYLLSAKAVYASVRRYAAATPNTIVVAGAITATMDGSDSAHFGTRADSAQLVGYGIANGAAWADDITGASSQIVAPVEVWRSADGTYLDVTFTTILGGLGIADASFASGVEGLFCGTTDPLNFGADMLVAGDHTVTKLAANQIRIAKNSGTFPAASGLLFNVNVGPILTDSTLDAENTRLARCLHLNDGKWGATRPGCPIHPALNDIVVQQA